MWGGPDHCRARYSHSQPRPEVHSRFLALSLGVPQTAAAGRGRAQASGHSLGWTPTLDKILNFQEKLQEHCITVAVTARPIFQIPAFRHAYGIFLAAFLASLSNGCILRVILKRVGRALTLVEHLSAAQHKGLVVPCFIYQWQKR